MNLVCVSFALILVAKELGGWLGLILWKFEELVILITSYFLLCAWVFYIDLDIIKDL